MKRLISWFNIIIKKRRELKRWQRIVTVLAAVTTFVTTYALILPAITVERDNTGEVGGMYLEQSAEQDVMVEEDALDPSGISIDAEQEDAAAYEYTDDAHVVKTLDVTGDDYTVVLTYDESSKIPEGAYLTASEISQDSGEYKTYLEETKKAMGLAEEETLPRFAARFFDIKIMVGDEEFTPEAGVSVEITYAEPLAEKAEAEVNAVHFADKKADVEVIEANTTEIQDDGAATVEFTAESFSVYGVIYTVDFNWEVDGKEYEYSLAGGDSISFRELVEMLHVVDGEEEGGEEEESETIDEFINHIADISFSNEELVRVARITEGITAGALKDKLELKCDYSDELTDVEREAMDSKVFYPTDWALISLKAFDTEEYLTVEMTDGEIFTIKVTDAQLKKTVIDAKGDTWEITVTYGEDAEIPEGADLEVREIEEESAEYVKYLQEATLRMNLTSSDLAFARFFDIVIVDENGEKVEPETPVQVEIAYKDTVEIDENQSLSIVHFGENGTEIIRDAVVSEDGTEITYEQSSFSVTGTIVQNAPVAGDQQMILVKDGTRYYIVNNDATLTEVGYDSATGTVSVIEPMLWTFEGSGNNRHIYFNSEATGFGTNQLASDYYRRYLDPTASTATHNGYTEENKDVSVSLGDYYPAQWWNQDTGTYVSNNYVSNRNTALNETTLTYDEGSHAIHQGNTYFAIERDDDGKPVRLVGQEGSAGAATFEFAEASELPNGFHLVNAVNHIDISIKGTAKVDVPLAYGSYYGPNGAAGPAIKVVDDNEKLELGEAQMVDPTQLGVTADDMKRATISASSPSNPELNDAFYITGFSQNTGTAYSTPQVRIEGKFLVADVPADQMYNGHSLRNVDGNLYDGQGWWGTGRDWNYVNAVRAARLANKVTYTVTVIKTLQYYLVDPELGQLYDSEGNPIIVPVDVAFSASFNYWDDENSANGGNECPPIQGNSDWKAGDIPNHDLSGMDFKLGGDAEDPNSPLLALEITKVIQDVNGNRIALKTPVTNTFEIHRSTTARKNGVRDINVDEYKTPVDDGIYEGYSPLHDKKITVGEQGMALVYDYNVTEGMYYIVEKSDNENLPKTITDTNDNEWKYVKTYIETEYVRRGDKYDDKVEYPNPMHVSQDYTTADGEYKSVPEVLGKFTTLTGEEKKSGFLEFFVYNIYEPDKTEITFNKVWPDAEGEGTDKTITIDGIQYDLSDMRIEAQLLRYVNGVLEDENTTKSALGESVWKQTLDGVADSVSIGDDPIGYETSNWSCIWTNLPSGNGGDTYTYSVKEVSVKTKDGTDLTDKFIQITDRTGSSGVTVTNTLNNTNVTLEKQWDPLPDGNWSATFKIQRSRRQITDSEGNTVTNKSWSEWEQAKESNGTNIDNVTINQDTTDAKITLNNLPKYYKDADGVIWEYKYKADEVSFTLNDAVSEWNREVAQEGDSAHGYAIVVKNKQSSTTTVIAEKKWRSSVASDTDIGSDDNNDSDESGAGSSESGSSNEGNNIADPNVTAVEFKLYELITDDKRPEDAVKIGVKWYKPATNADGQPLPSNTNPQKVSRGGGDAWTGQEKATWTNLSRDKTYYVLETGIYYKNGSSELYLPSAPNYSSGGEVDLVNGQRTATIFNAPITLQLSKKWSGLTEDEEWPEGFTVEYSIEREYSYNNGSDLVTGKDNSFEFNVTANNENSQYLLNNDQRVINLTGMFPAGGVRDGHIVSYTYFVKETKVNTPNDSPSYTFKTGERKVFLEDGTTVGLLKADLNNQLTSVSVRKEWTGNHATDQATVTLYKYVDTSQQQTKVITVKLAENTDDVATRTNLGNRTVYVVMDGDEATKQELSINSDTVTFEVADDAEHYFTYSLSDTNNGRLTVTGQGHAHAGETVNVAVQDNIGSRKTVIFKLVDKDHVTLGSGKYVTVTFNGEEKQLTNDNGYTATFYVLGEGTFNADYIPSDPVYMGITGENGGVAPRQIAINQETTTINLEASTSQPFTVRLDQADQASNKWGDGDFIRVLIDDGDRGSITFRPENGTVSGWGRLNLGDDNYHSLTIISGGNITNARFENNVTQGKNGGSVGVKWDYDPTLSLEKGTLTFNIVPDGNFRIQAPGLVPSGSGVDTNVQNSYRTDVNLDKNNTQKIINNIPISWTYSTNQLQYYDVPSGKTLHVEGEGCTATIQGNTLTVSNITSKTPTVTFSTVSNNGTNNVSPKRSVSLFARLLSVPTRLFSAGNTRTSFDAVNGLIVTGVEDLPQGAEIVGTYTGTGNSWDYTWKDLPLVDEQGRTIQYFVRETGVTTTRPYETVEASHTVVQNDDGSYSVVINNTTTGDEPQTGAIKITKEVMVNNSAPTDSNKAKTNGTFEFSVNGIADTDTADISHTVKITFADGKAVKYQIDSDEEQSVSGTDNTWSVILDELTPGDYTIAETAPTNGMVLKTVEGTNVNSSTKVATVTVTAGDTTPTSTNAQVKFTNNYTEYEVVIVKADIGNTTKKLGGAEFDLYAASQVEEKDGKKVVKENEEPINSSKLVSSSAEDESKGKVSLGTLAAGTYYLFETKAPSGYIIMDMPVTIMVSEGNVSLMQGTRNETGTITQGKAELTVMNSAGVTLPNTGGPGTFMLYLLGFVLVAFAGTVFMIKRRFGDAA